MTKAGKPLRIIIAGGGTGGHLFPGIAIAEMLLKKRDCEIHFVGTKRGIESRVLPQTQYVLYTLPIAGLYRVGLKKKIITLIKLPLAFFKSAWILLTFRPQLVIGVGGFASGPFLVAALFLFKRTVLQEQNAYPGMTNRLLGKQVPLAFIPFSHSQHLFKNPVVVGNPIREAIKSASRQVFSRNPVPFVITIIGGSQGAHILNKTMLEALPLLQSIAERIKIIHQTGKNDFEWVSSEYKKFPAIHVLPKEFFDEIAPVYQQSHLLICRSGGITNEIIAMGRASILVPIATSSGDHQKENALVMKSARAAIMIEERELNASVLAETIKKLINSPEQLTEMERNAKSLYQGDSAEMIVDKILEFFRL